MDRCSYFIKDKALFGSYPDKDNVKELRENGVKIFIDVTNNHDNLDAYTPLKPINKSMKKNLICLKFFSLHENINKKQKTLTQN